jgi:fucose 4-O-acetylase-like acetyltransferase
MSIDNPEKHRIEYVDFVKGFCVLWVALLHSYSGNDTTDIALRHWLFVQYRMPLFFFMSGIFFRLKPFNEFIKIKIKTLIIPFLGFWLIGLFFAVFKYEIIANLISIDYKGMGSFVEYATSLKWLFYMRPSMSPCIVNEPLWFLIALFITQLLQFPCCKFIKKKSIIIFIGMLLFIAGIYLKEHKITGPFYLIYVCQLYIFYSAGNLFGKDVINILNKRDILKKILICCSLPLIILPFIHINNLLIKEIFMFIRAACFIPVIFTVCKTMNNVKIIIPVIKYCGRHSLEVFATHMLLISLLHNFIFKIIFASQSAPAALFPGQFLSALIVFLLCIALEYFIVIKFCSKYLYFLLGKSKNKI